MSKLIFVYYDIEARNYHFVDAALSAPETAGRGWRREDSVEENELDPFYQTFIEDRAGHLLFDLEYKKRSAKK